MAKARQKVAKSALGPVEYLVVAFPENHFTGEIAHELGALVRNGVIHVLDLVFVTKDTEGDVRAFEVDELDRLAPFAAIEGEVGGLLSDEDVAHAAEALRPNTSAALVVWEDVWASPFAEALRAAGAVLVEGGRIPQDEIERALTSLPPAGESAA